MADPDVVVRLLAAIDERTATGRAALGHHWTPDSDEAVPGDGVWTHENTWVSVALTGDTVAACTWDDYEHTHMQTEHAAHIAANDPASVLRLCQSHRDIVAEWREARGAAEADESFRVAAFALMLVIRHLARGYGIEEETTDDD